MKIMKQLLVFAVVLTLCSGLYIGKKQISAADLSSKEYRAVWFCYDDFSQYRSSVKSNNKASFKAYFTKVVKNAKSLGMNTIIVQVRPFGDAIYKSSYFPWSKYISGKQGKSPGYDPLKIMVTVAHNNNMKIEAWINPYRVTSGTTSYASLSQNNQARKWHSTKGKKRTVLAYGGSLYYNPSRIAVRNLIARGVKEIVKNYAVDGIHMDDYFYPSFSSGNVNSAFDAKEYNKSAAKKNGVSIARYRRDQVNLLVKQIHDTVKSVNPNVTFGISPAGELSNLRSDYSYYVDVDTWVKSSSYVDYLTPQIYWGFKHPTARFDKVMKQWSKLTANSPVKLYVGIAAYKVRSNAGIGREKAEWKTDTTILKKEVVYARKYGAKGFAFFDYADMIRPKNKTVMKKLKSVMN